MRENHRPSLPKWPFYFGDIFLVSIAIVLAFQGEGPLTALQFFWCFLTVATGAVLFALPFIIEFNGHVKISQKSDTGNTHELARRLEAAVYEIQDTKETILQQANKQAIANTMLETTLKNVEARLAKLSDSQKTLSTLASEMSSESNKTLALQNEETLLSVNHKLDQLVQQQSSTTIEELETLVLQFQELLTQLEARPTQATTVFGQTATATQQAKANTTNTGTITQTADGKKVFDIQNLTHSAQDCFIEETNNSFPTQSDVLNNLELDVNSAKDEFQGLIPQKTQTQETQTSTKPLNQWNINKEATEAETATDTHLTREATDSEGSEMSAQTQAQPSTASTTTSADMPLFEATPTMPTTSENRLTTTLTANVMTGIGKKPYLRGEGPGLSWEKGIPMDFVEIGKWQWTTSSASPSQPITCQIYKNDETPAEGGVFTLNAGQALEINPTFSG